MAIRPISDQDFRDYYQIMINAYPDGRSNEEAEIQRYVQERTESQNAAPQPIFYGCFRDEKLQGVGPDPNLAGVLFFLMYSQMVFYMWKVERYTNESKPVARTLRKLVEILDGDPPK